MSKNRKRVTKLISYTAIFIAANVVLNSLSIPVLGGDAYISFTYIPCFLSGILLGPLPGFLVGAIGDGIGFLIHPTGVWSPFITLGAALMGAIPGFVFRIPRLRPYTKLSISLGLVFIICSFFLNSTGLFFIYGIGKKAYWFYVLGRIPKYVPGFAVNAVLLYTLYAPVHERFIKIYGIDNKEKSETIAESPDSMPKRRAGFLSFLSRTRKTSGTISADEK